MEKMTRLLLELIVILSLVILTSFVFVVFAPQTQAETEGKIIVAEPILPRLPQVQELGVEEFLGFHEIQDLRAWIVVKIQSQAEEELIDSSTILLPVLNEGIFDPYFYRFADLILELPAITLLGVVEELEKGDFSPGDFRRATNNEDLLERFELLEENLEKLAVLLEKQLRVEEKMSKMNE